MNAKKDKYPWEIGKTPPKLDPHSKVKHKVVVDYLRQYIQVLMSNFLMPKLTLTLVDGFAGGGLYLDDTNNITHGSPVLMMQAVQEEEALLNIKSRERHRKIDAHFHFVEKNKETFDYLKWVLCAEGHSKRFIKDIFLHNEDVEKSYQKIIRDIAKRKGGERAIFLLDQYNYSDISLSVIRDILSSLKGAEVILTFNYDSLITYLSNTPKFHKATEKISLRKYINWEEYNHLKANKKWRKIIQKQISYGILQESGARFMTLFFVTPQGSTPWSYWLVHLSNEYKANDVMKDIHWKHGNNFGHSLEPGLFQIGYNANMDEDVTKQSSFSFSDIQSFERELHESSVSVLTEELPKIISSREGVSLLALMEGIANVTTATLDVAKESLHELVATKEIIVRTSSGGTRKKSSAIKVNDILEINKQRSIFLP